MTTRSGVDHTGNGNPYNDTFLADGTSIVFERDQPRGTSKRDLAVMLGAADSTVSLATDGKAILGRLERVEPDGKVVVQVDGYMRLPAGTSPNLARGSKVVGCLLSSAPGYVRTPLAATAAEHVLSRGIQVDISDTTKVGILM